MNGRDAAVAVLAAVLLAPAPAAHAEDSVISGTTIPFLVIDAATGCASTGGMTPAISVTPGLVVTETITARVTSNVCRMTWNLDVEIIDNAPGFVSFTTRSGGSGETAMASASQRVTYATAASPTPNAVRGPSELTFIVMWTGSNGVRGCYQNRWVVASYTSAYEVGPYVPCDDRIHLE